MHHDYVKYHFNRTIFLSQLVSTFLFHEKKREKEGNILGGEYHFRVKRSVDSFTRHVNEPRDAPKNEIKNKFQGNKRNADQVEPGCVPGIGLRDGCGSSSISRNSFPKL